MRRTLRLFLSQCLVAGLAVPLSVAAQDTRGKISGTVRDNAGVIPGASVKVTNTETSVSQNLTTNESGYFEASFLNPGTYTVGVQMPGYKAAVRGGINLGVGEQLTVPFTLEVGQISEEVVVKAESPLIDTTSLRSAARFDTHLVESLPMFSNMPITLARFAPSTSVNDQQTQVSQGYVDNTSLSAGSGLGLPLGGTQPNPPSFGGNNYTLDGANNNGSSRRIAASPNADMIQEMRVESSNFDASAGHGLGLQISMMTRAGTNKQHGTANYQYWTNSLNSLTAQQKLTFDDRAQSEFDKGRSHNLSLTSGGPVRIPGLIDGRGKLFYFGNYSYANDAIPGKIQGSITVPANANHLKGDFSDLLKLPNPAQYQIYDPLTTHPDPANPSRMIRDPFPNNVIPHEPDLQSGRHLQEPADGAVLQAGAAAEPELPRERAAAERQLLSGRAARLPQEPSVRLPPRLQCERHGSVVLPHQRRHVPGVRERLDVSESRPEAADELRGSLAVSVVVHRHVDAHDGQDRRRYLVRHEPLQPGRPVLRVEAVQADRREPALLSRRVLLGARRLHAALDRDRRLSRHGRRTRRRRYRHTHPGAVVDHVGERDGTRCQGGVDLRRAMRDRTGGGNRSGAVHLRSHLHAPVQRRELTDAEQPRLVAGGVRARAADLRVDQRRGTLELQQQLDGRRSARTPGGSAT
jgi:hypothetical protein